MDSQSWSKRIEKFRATKTQVFWACAACAVATIFVGFNWGGWVTGTSAREMTAKAAADARAELASAFCVHQFASNPTATVQLAALKSTDSWKRSEFIEKGGWVTLPGTDKLVAGAAALCAKQLTEVQASPALPTGTAG